MNPVKAVMGLITAKRRAAQEHADFISVIRQAAALLSAGRPLTQLWPEVAQAHKPCDVVPQPEAADPRCCMHHVLIAQQSAAMLQQPYFVDVTRPGHHNGWQQRSEERRVGKEGRGRGARDE